MKKLTILWITILGVYLIYNLVNVNKINYVSISDMVMNNYNDYVKSYLLDNNKLGSFNNSFINSSIIKTYKDIESNRTIRVINNDFYIKKVLRESDVLVISVGQEELINNFSIDNMNSNYHYFSIQYSNIERLIKEIKKYTYGKILFLGFYNPTNYYDANIDSFFYDMDVKLNRLMMDNKVIYIDLYELIKGNLYKNNNSLTLNKNGNKKIASIIESYL